jgi:hypothetical protein
MLFMRIICLHFVQCNNGINKDKRLSISECIVPDELILLNFYLFFCKCMGLASILDSIQLDLAMHQVQGCVGLTRMPDPIRLDLVVSQIQGALADPLRLDLAVRQVQGDIGLARMPDPLRFDLAISQIQDIWTL